MRVGIFLPKRDSRPTGLGVFLEEVVGRVAEQFRELMVWGEHSESVEGGKCGIRYEPLWGEGGGIGQRWRLSRRVRRVLAVQWRLREQVRDYRCEVFLFPFHEGFLLPPVPQVVVVHDLTCLRYPVGRDFLERFYTAWVFRRVLERCAGIVAVSRSTKEDLTELLGIKGDKVRVVYEGYDRTVFKRPEEGAAAETLARYGIERRFVFYAGTFAKNKNLDMLLDAFLEVVKRKGDALLVTAGRVDTRQFRDFDGLCKSMGLSSHVRNLGYVPRPDLPVLMRCARSFVYPSLYEGFGLAVLEAMASGAFVIASNCASLPEVVGDSGVLIDAHDKSAWIREIENSLETDFASTESLRQRGMARAEFFSWDRTAENLAEVLRDAASSNIV